jgi:hypothetical protein
MSEIDRPGSLEPKPSKLIEVDFTLVISRLIETAKTDPM